MSLAHLLAENEYTQVQLEDMVELLLQHIMEHKKAGDQDETTKCGTSDDVEPMADYEPEEHDDDLEQTIIIKRIANDQPFKTNIREDNSNNIIHVDEMDVGGPMVKFTMEGTTYTVPIEGTLMEGSDYLPAVKFDVEINGEIHRDIVFGITDSKKGCVDVGNIPY